MSIQEYFPLVLWGLVGTGFVLFAIAILIKIFKPGKEKKSKKKEEKTTEVKIEVDKTEPKKKVDKSVGEKKSWTWTEVFQFIWVLIVSLLIIFGGLVVILVVPELKTGIAGFWGLMCEHYLISLAIAFGLLAFFAFRLGGPAPKWQTLLGGAATIVVILILGSAIWSAMNGNDSGIPKIQMSQSSATVPAMETYQVTSRDYTKIRALTPVEVAQYERTWLLEPGMEVWFYEQEGKPSDSDDPTITMIGGQGSSNPKHSITGTVWAMIILPKGVTGDIDSAMDRVFKKVH